MLMQSCIQRARVQSLQPTNVFLEYHTMKFSRYFMLSLAIAAMVAFSGVSASAANSKQELDTDAAQALKILTSKNPTAANIAKQAKAILIFPSIVKAGLVFGGAYGEGVLQQGGKTQSYYNSITASFGWQAGAQSYGYAVFLMNDKALKFLRDTKGWEIGVGPTVVLVNEGVAKNLSSTTLKDDAYAFIFDQQGLMASLSIEGTKITQINQP